MESMDDRMLLVSLENRGYRMGNCVEETKEKLREFVKFFNSSARLAFREVNKTRVEELVYLLNNLKDNITATVNDLEKAHKEFQYHFSCPTCGVLVQIDKSTDVWSSLQDHPHFEDLYCEKLSNALAFETSTSSSQELLNENCDNELEDTDNELYNGGGNIPPSYEPAEEDINSFRFNFKWCYDPLVEQNLYPKNLTMSIRRLDKCEYYSIQRTGQLRAACLLCCKELKGRARITKNFLNDHAIGQKHLISSRKEKNLAVLRTYHETWLAIEMPYQAHQMYFMPDLDAVGLLKCILCGSFVKCNQVDIELHIDSSKHKKLVLGLKRDGAIHIFNILDASLGVYGENVTKPEQVENEAAVDKAVKKNKTKSDKIEPVTSEMGAEESKHNIIKSVNSASPYILDLIANRFRKTLKDKNGKIHCQICDANLSKSLEVISQHLRHPMHVNAANSPLKNYKYYCEICNLKIPNEILWHKHFTEGPNYHANMAPSRRSRVTEYECTLCLTVIFGDELSLSRHLYTTKRNPKQIRLSDRILKLFSSKENLDRESKRLAKESEDVLRNNAVMLQCCERLAQCMKSVFNDCKAVPFGSRMAGLGNQESDLDVFIDVGDMYTGKQQQDTYSQVTLIRKASNVFFRHREEFSDIVTVATARTPIVRLFHVPTDIDCDLSFRHGLSVENTKFLRFCMDIQPNARPFILVLKQWSEINGIREHMSNYTLSLMAVFYLQVNGYLLSVKKLRQFNPQPSIIISGWETLNYTTSAEEMKTKITPCSLTVDKLLIGFFEYYCKFDYVHDVVCPLLGHIIKKELFKSKKKLMVDMNSYVQQLEGEEAEEFRAQSVFCIQDPFDLSHNLTKAWQTGTLNKFKVLCDLSIKQLTRLN